MKKIIILSALVFWAGSGAAQQSWSLRQCIEHAIAHNVDILQAENSAKQSEIEVNTSRWARLPNLNAGGSQSFNWGRTQTAVKDEDTGDYTTKYINTSSQGTNMSLSTSVPLFTGFEIPNQQALSKLNLKAAMADLQKAKEDLSVNVASAYLQVLFNRELHAVAMQQTALSKEQYERISRLEQLGRASASEVAEARSRVAQDELNAVQAKNSYDLSVLDLTQLIELETPAGFEPEDPASAFQIGRLTPPDEIFQEALISKPAIQAAQARLEGSKHSIKIAQSALYPSLSLNGSIGTSYYSTLNRNFREQLGDNFSKYIGVSLNIPLFNRFATRNRVRSARLQQDSYALQLESVRKALYKEIQQAWYNAVASESKYVSSEAASEASLATFELASKKYESGTATAVEYNEAKQNLLKARSEELQAKYEYIFRTKILDFYQGKDIY